MERIARLEAQVQRLDAENRQLLEPFVRWAYNAHTRGLDMIFESRPSPRQLRPNSAKMIPGPKKASHIEMQLWWKRWYMLPSSWKVRKFGEMASPCFLSENDDLLNAYKDTGSCM